MNLGYVHPSVVARIASHTAEEKFIPPTLSGAVMIACYMGGNADGSNDVIALVRYKPEGEYRAKIAQRPDVDTALEDCQLWLGEIRREYKKGLKKDLKEEEKKEEKMYDR